MKRITILFLLISTFVFSQEPITKELGPFKELKVFSGLVVKIEKAATSSIEISGKKANDVMVKNINGRLKISMRFPETFNAYEVDIKLYYTDNLFLIDANEGSNVHSKNKITQQSIEVKVQEGAIINLPIDVKYLVGKAVTGGQLIIDGKAESQDIELLAGGIYDGYDLISNQTYITSSSGAVGNVFVKEMLDAKVSLGGIIYYKGNPTDITTKKIIGGTIKSKD